MQNDIHEQIRSKLLAAERVLIVSHVRPDGDAIGSLLALGLGLLARSKQVQMILTDGMPGSFKHLEGADLVKLKAEGDVDLIVVVDCSDFQRTGKALVGYPIPDIIIDHHVTNDGFGTLNLIQPEAVATSEIMAENFVKWGLEITPAVANALITGIVTDTLGFRTSNMRSKTMRLTADLMEKGANLPEQYSNSLLRRSFTAAKYWGAGLSSLERKNGMVWGTLSLEAREACNYPGNDDADLINIISAINDFDVSMIFVEQKNGSVKVSWRSIPGFDVSKIAVQFGGGGHPAAAGADISGTLLEIQEKVLDTTEKLLKSHYKNE
jgi:phosphoesterase RecJ-like protein